MFDSIQPSGSWWKVYSSIKNEGIGAIGIDVMNFCAMEA